MRGVGASRRGRWLSILVAGVVGFLLGNWHAATPRPNELSPSQKVALRFPEVNAETAVAETATEAPTGATSGAVLGDARLALLSPDPMVPAPVQERLPQAEPPQPAAPAEAALPEAAAPSPAPQAAPTPRSNPSVSEPRAELKKSAAQSATRHPNRPGYMLNDAQIASIKARLHLTPDQERMWPAVEVALRNIAYAKAREAQRRGVSRIELASLDPDGAAVQGLKSAAVPLIMSFSDEQKNEVRSLAHVLGLDRLASQF